jgi:threonylcarbamoyladenosine tRNA methylthiotransferase MtaB
METYNFVNELDVSYFHVFTYSERPNTVAAEMGHQVPKKVRGQRSKMLRILSEKKRRHFYRQLEGDERPVLFEGKIENGFITGHSDNYVKVKVPVEATAENRIEPVELTAIDDDGNMKGQIATPVTI